MNLFVFDFQEFVTSPAGILIIVGVLFLLVGIVMFLKEGKKNGKDTSEVKKDENVSTTAPVEEPKKVEETKAPDVAPTIEPAPAVTETPAPVVVPTEGDGVQEVPVAKVEEKIEFSEPSTPAPAVQTLTPAPAVEALTPEVEAPTVYGGVSPEVPKAEVLEEKPREIYGGANPLENTAPIPTVTNATVSSETPAVNPTPVETVAPTPAVEEVPAATVAPTPEVAAPVETTPVAPAPEEKKEEIEKLEF